MDPVVETKREAVAGICRRYGVARLEVFGSAARGGFVPGKSDIDLLFEFDDMGRTDFPEAFVELKAALGDLFGCSVDLLTLRSVENRILRAEIERAKGLLFAA